MHSGENHAAVTAPTLPTGNQILASRAGGDVEVAPSDAASTEAKPTWDRAGFLLILLRAFSAWET